MEYLGITYHLPANRVTWWLWRRVFCPRGWHLFDEVSSLDEHCLYCDACGFSVQIAREACGDTLPPPPPGKKKALTFFVQPLDTTRTSGYTVSSE